MGCSDEEMTTATNGKSIHVLERNGVPGVFTKPRASLAFRSASARSSIRENLRISNTPLVLAFDSAPSIPTALEEAIVLFYTQTT